MDRASKPARDEASGARDLLVELEFRRGRLRQTLGASLRKALQQGRFPAGTTLPSSRRLAADLGVSRGVVSDVYDQLASEGYLRVTARTAPVVAAAFAAPRPAPDPPVQRWRFDLTAITPDIRLFPRRAWLRAVDRALHDAPDAVFDYGDHRGRIELRVALSAYLARVRGVRVHAGCIVVTQGFTQALDLLCRVLLARGVTTLAMETPTHPELCATARQAGLDVVGCRVDEDGLRVGDLAGLRAGAVVVAPAHQFPTGAVLTSERRRALLDWAADGDRLVIEDDYDAEFRYDRAPIGAVQGLDPTRVAHVGTASKTLAPGVRLGWASLPADLVDEVRTAKGRTDSGSPTLDQLAFAHFVSCGDYDRHVVRARNTYRRRRDRLTRALHAALPLVGLRGAGAGMHVLVPLPDHADDVAVATDAARRGVGVLPLSAMHVEPSPRRGLVLGYGRLTEARIEEAVAILAPMLRRAMARARALT